MSMARRRNSKDNFEKNTVLTYFEDKTAWSLKSILLIIIIMNKKIHKQMKMKLK